MCEVPPKWECTCFEMYESNSFSSQVAISLADTRQSAQSGCAKRLAASGNLTSSACNESRHGWQEKRRGSALTVGAGDPAGQLARHTESRTTPLGWNLERTS